jgi:surface polysaccharide O-acyltransferase-like enzyme
MIVLLHASAALQYCSGRGVEYSFWTFICSCLMQFALPALFLLSGYLLFKNYSFKSYPQKLLRRVKRLFVPYVIWNFTFVVIYLLIGRYVPRIGDRVVQFELDTFKGAFSKVLGLFTHPIDGPLWFIRTLFILSIVSPLFYLILKTHKPQIRYLGFLVIILYYVLSYSFGIIDFLSMTYPPYSLSLFFIGGLIATSNKKSASLNFASSFWIIPCLIGLGLVSFVVFNPQIAHTPLYASINDLGKFLMAPGLFYLVCKCNLGRLSRNKLFVFAKELSFFSYAGHFLFCSTIMHLAASRLHFIGGGRATILIFIFCLIGVLFMAIVYSFGKRFFPHLVKLYDGTL